MKEACRVLDPLTTLINNAERNAFHGLLAMPDEAPFINASCITIDGGRSVVYHD